MNTAAFNAFCDRKAERYSAVGRQHERYVLNVLLNAVRDKLLDSAILHEPNSIPDTEGRDFTVTRRGVSRSFGITISRASWIEAQVKHPNVRQFYWPVNITPETITRRVLELFQ